MSEGRLERRLMKKEVVLSFGRVGEAGAGSVPGGRSQELIVPLYTQKGAGEGEGGPAGGQSGVLPTIFQGAGHGGA